MWLCKSQCNLYNYILYNIPIHIYYATELIPITLMVTHSMRYISQYKIEYIMLITKNVLCVLNVKTIHADDSLDISMESDCSLGSGYDFGSPDSSFSSQMRVRVQTWLDDERCRDTVPSEIPTFYDAESPANSGSWLLFATIITAT